jgi:ABC-type dipeptide/oligopeptide/nickel transport system ATPase component
LELLQKLQKTHRFAVLLITHDLRVASHYSDYVGVMNAGRLLEFKKTKDFLSNPTEAYSRKLVESANRISVSV